jgi:hypothetical protein
MKRSFPLRKIFLILIVLVVGCLEPYEPPTTKNNIRMLVVDAFLNTTQGIMEVKLSYTTPLTSNVPPPKVDFATVELQDDEGRSIPLFWMGGGRYQIQGTITRPDKTYRIYIRTETNKEYVSDFIVIKHTPPIDEINYSIDGDDLEINVNTHDPSGNSRYYRWTYVETWVYRSNYPSAWVLPPGAAEPRLREPSEDINVCWRSDTLKQIIVGSTSHLSEDVVSNFNLIKIRGGALKLSERYSVLVQQQTLPLDAYNYYLSLQKSTESLGGLFDPQPSQLEGNIHSLNDPDEQVIGFFSGGEVSEKRIFIDKDDLPQGFPKYLRPLCPMDTIPVAEVRGVTDPDALIYAVYPMGFPVIIGYTTAEKPCIDCRKFAGGVTTKPYFWE